MSAPLFDPNKHPRDANGRFSAKGYAESDVALDDYFDIAGEEWYPGASVTGAVDTPPEPTVERLDPELVNIVRLREVRTGFDPETMRPRPPEGYTGETPVDARYLDEVSAYVEHWTKPENTARRTPHELSNTLSEAGGVVAQRAHYLSGVDTEHEQKAWKARYDTMVRKARLSKGECILHLKNNDGSQEYRQRLDDLVHANTVYANRALEIANGKDDDSLTVKTKLADGYLRAIAETRSVGTVTPSLASQKSDPAAMRRVTEGFSVYPDDWVAASNTGKPLIAKNSRGRAAYYNATGSNYAKITARKSESHVNGRGDGFRTAVHEVGHHMGTTVPGLSEAENDFLNRRTQGSRKTEHLGRGYGRDERYFTGGRFVENYVAKDYSDYEIEGTTPTEVTSIGVESIFAGEHGGLNGLARTGVDEDHRNFILGCLSGIHRAHRS